MVCACLIVCVSMFAKKWNGFGDAKSTWSAIARWLSSTARRARSVALWLSASMPRGWESRCVLDCTRANVKWLAHRGRQSLCGIAPQIGAQVANAAAAGEILVSSTVKDLVAGSGIGV